MSKSTIGVFMFFAFLLGIVSTVSFSSWRGTAVAPSSSQATQDEVQKIVVRVGRLIVLPSGEQPTIATVTDPDKLRDQAFFANAKIGDRVLIYANARKAILYNPDADKIVEVAPLTIGPVTPPTPTPPPSSTSTRK